MLRAFLSVLGLTLVSFDLPAQPYRPQVGELHPDFTLPRIDNREPVSLSDLRGQKVLLIQFASW